MNKFKTSEIVLALFAILIAILIIYKTSPTKISPTVKIEIFKQDEHIPHIDFPRAKNEKKTFFVDSIDFINPQTLKHPKTGELGFSSNFFADFYLKAEIKKKGEYFFSIFSDDGFRLFVDGKPICEFIADRPIAKTECKAFLEKGEREIKLSYYQGGGNMGLRVYYREKDFKKERLMGQNSDNIKFMELK